MKVILIKPKNENLKKYIQYFLFFKKEDNQIINYTTFPNTNLCLSIYKQNKIEYDNAVNINSCKITHGAESYSSRFYGFHKLPFQVNINTQIDQVCIVFFPSALSMFTSESYFDLMHSSNAFEAIFGLRNSFFLEQLFEFSDFSKRANHLEIFLLKNLKANAISIKLREALCWVSGKNDENITVESLSKAIGVSDTTLFRLFKKQVGQNPKSYIKTMRFRNVLNDVLQHNCSFTNIAYSNQFYDQAHFNHEFKSLAGYTPKHLIKIISVQQNDFTWICNKIKVE